MADIKIKEKAKGMIKTLNKSAIVGERLKSNIVSTKEKSENAYVSNDENVNDYATNKLYNGTRNNIHRAKKFNDTGKKAYDKSKQNIKVAKDKLKEIRNNKRLKNTIKTSNKTIKGVKSTADNTKKYIKTSENVAKVTEKATKEAVKNSQRIARMAKKAAQDTVRAIKLSIKAIIHAIKLIIAATKALIMFLIAGGWIVVIIVIVICMIGLLVSSIFGIFFSSEDVGTGYRTMSSVVSELNTEYMNKITQIQQDNPYDEYDITGSRAEWKDILAVYVAKVSNGDNSVEMMTLDDSKVETLKTIFWEMNEITYTTDVETSEQIIIHLTWTEHKTTTYTKLHITINSKTASEMADQYNFSQAQRSQLDELLSEQYASMWSAVLYGSSVGSSDIVTVALEQVGNTGGEPYWSWYGFSERVEWCACFVSWCANECRLY